MRHILSAAVTLFLLFAPTFSHAIDDTADVSGYWLTENERAVVRITPCNDSMCGAIHWIIEGGMSVDSKNPDESKRNMPLCGLPILWGFDQSGDDWKGGKIYKADEGDTYNANITLKDDNTLYLRGYVGVPLFGKSQTWTRVQPSDYPACTPE